jgi:hypothetical protein
MSFDPIAPEFLLSEVVKRFPDLEALHVVILLTELTYVRFFSTTAMFVTNNSPGLQENLKASGPLLAGFKLLQVYCCVEFSWIPRIKTVF